MKNVVIGQPQFHLIGKTDKHQTFGAIYRGIIAILEEFKNCDYIFQKTIIVDFLIFFLYISPRERQNLKKTGNCYGFKNL